MRVSLLISVLVLIVEVCDCFRHWSPVIARRVLKGSISQQIAEGTCVNRSHAELVTYIEKQASYGVTELCKVIGYKQSPVPSFNLKLNQLWRLRGSAELPRTLNKEDVPLLCTFGPKGQGKTELCRQLVLSHSLFTSCKGIEVVLPIMVSYFGSTGYDSDSIDIDIERGFAFRALKSCGLPPMNVHSISDLCGILRGSGGREVMILFVVDELLKIPEEPLRDLLDSLTNVQHNHLERGFATFTLVTSLSTKPVKDPVVIESGRRLSPVQLPVPQADDLTDIADRLFQYFVNITTMGEASDSPLRDERNIKDCRRLIKAIVSISGLHFRTLDFASRELYKKVVSPHKHNLIEAAGYPTLADGNQDAESFSQWSSVSVRDLFVDGTSSGSGIDFESPMSLFQWTLLNPNVPVNEAGFRDLEAAGLMYVKERDLHSIEQVIPKVKLPYLFSVALKNRIQLKQLKLIKNEQGFLRDIVDRELPLSDWLSMLMHNIGEALYKNAYSELPTLFERVMPWIELVRIAALKKERKAASRPERRLISLLDVLPGAVVNPWTPDDAPISVYNGLIDEALIIEEPMKTDDKLLKTVLPSDKTYHMIKQARSSHHTAVVHQGTTNTQFIEYVSRYYSNDRPLLGLCSMKFRIPANCDPIALSSEIHEFAKGRNLNPRNYFVFVYCVNEQLPMPEELPPGTVVVGMPTLRQILPDFGASFLLDVAEQKSKSGV